MGEMAYQLALGVRADDRYGGSENGEISEPYNNLLALKGSDVRISLCGKGRRNSGVPGGQIWRWNSHNEDVAEPAYTKGVDVGYNISVCSIILPAHGVMSLTKCRRSDELRTAQLKKHSVPVRRELIVTWKRRTRS